MTKRAFFLISHLALLFTLPFLFPTHSYAQGYQSFSSELDQIVKTARWRVGPFRIYPRINFRLLGYDNNVFYQGEEEGPTSDFTATLSPEVRIYFLFRNYLILSLTERPEYVHYFKQKRERRLNNTITPAIKFLLLSRFAISSSYSRRTQRWRASSEFNMRTNEIREDYSGSIFYETARRTSIGVSIASSKISYEDITLGGQEVELSRFLSRTEERKSVEFYYRVFSDSLFFLRGMYTEHNFEDQQSRVKDSNSYQANTGISFPLFGRVRGTLSIGYKKLLPRTGDKKSFSGLVGDTSLEYRIGRFSFRLNYNRDCPFSYWTNNVFYIVNQYTAGISTYVTRFLRLDYNYSYGKAHYPELIPLRHEDGSYEEIKRKDTYIVHTAGLVVRIIRNIGIGVRANFWKRSSNYLGESRDRFFLNTYISYEF